MSLTNPNVGLQLDTDTVLLYKSIAETSRISLATPEIVTDNGQETHSLDLTQTNEPGRTWGPLGNATVTTTPRYAFAFSGGREGNDEYLVSGTIPGAFSTSMAADQTWHIAVRPQTNSDGAPISIVGNSGDDAEAENFLFRVTLSGGDIIVFWEAGAGVNQQCETTGGNHYTIGDWHVITVIRRERAGDATKFDTLIHILGGPYSTRTLVGQFDADGEYSAGNGLKPSGGTNANVYVGSSDGSLAMLHGEMSYLVCYDDQQSLSTIDLVQASLLSGTSQLPTQGVSELTVVDWDLGAYAPTFIDESPQGLHAMSDGYADFDSPANDGALLDLISSGGQAKLMTAAQAVEIKTNSNAADVATLLGSSATSLDSLFNRTVSDPPEYTLQLIGLIYPDSGGVTLIDYQPVGASEAQNRNVLAQAQTVTGGDNLPLGLLGTFFAESGAGTDITLTLDSGSSLFSDAEDAKIGRFLWTMRVDDDPGNPGDLRVRHSWNNTIDALVYTAGDTPQGGEDINTLELASLLGRVQEIKLSKVAISNSQIGTDWNQIVGPGVTPTITGLTPATATAITRDTSVTFTVENLQAQFTIWVSVQYENVKSKWVVYDTGGFTPSFADFSTAVVTTGQVAFSIKPAGGWLGAITELRIEAANGGSP